MTTPIARKNQNLSTIVRNHNRTHGTKLTVEQGAKQNKLKDPNKIFVGQRIRLTDGFDAPKTRAPQRTNPQNAPRRSEQKPQTQVKTPVNTQPTRPAEPARELRKPGFLEWLVTYKPLG